MYAYRHSTTLRLGAQYHKRPHVASMSSLGQVLGYSYPLPNLPVYVTRQKNVIASNTRMITEHYESCVATSVDAVQHKVNTNGGDVTRAEASLMFHGSPCTNAQSRFCLQVTT